MFVSPNNTPKEIRTFLTIFGTFVEGESKFKNIVDEILLVASKHAKKEISTVQVPSRTFSTILWVSEHCYEYLIDWDIQNLTLDQYTLIYTKLKENEHKIICWKD